MIWFLIIILAGGILLLGLISAQPGKKGKAANRGKTSRGLAPRNLDREFVARKWATIQTMSRGTGSSLRDSVSEADKLLDYALKNTGVPGETMGERLKHSGQKFSDTNAIWRAHKLRNALAHEVEFDLVASQAREAVADFGQGLKDLGAL